MPAEDPWRAVSERLEAGLADLGLPKDPIAGGRLLEFLRLLARWNRAYNLTAVREPLAMVARHVLDSLALRPYLLGSRVLDVGTGAGLPGIPLAIFEPQRHFVLLDSNGKKVRFVRQAVLELGLNHIEPIQARMETYRPEEKFATITSRAVAGQPFLESAAGRLLARPGRLLVMKGRYPQAELASVRTGFPRVHRLAVPFQDSERHLLEIRYD